MRDRHIYLGSLRRLVLLNNRVRTTLSSRRQARFFLFRGSTLYSAHTIYIYIKTRLYLCKTYVYCKNHSHACENNTTTRTTTILTVRVRLQTSHNRMHLGAWCVRVRKIQVIQNICYNNCNLYYIIIQNRKNCIIWKFFDLGQKMVCKFYIVLSVIERWLVSKILKIIWEHILFFTKITWKYFFD